VPETGTYDIMALIRVSSAAASQIGVEVNGTVKVRANQTDAGQTTSTYIFDRLQLNKGDTVEITNAAGSNLTISTTTGQNVFAIARIK
jgi:rare lipoprotein A (peptidoglycan hydrolase)